MDMLHFLKESKLRGVYASGSLSSDLLFHDFVIHLRGFHLNCDGVKWFIDHSWYQRSLSSGNVVFFLVPLRLEETEDFFLSFVNSIL